MKQNELVKDIVRDNKVLQINIITIFFIGALFTVHTRFVIEERAPLSRGFGSGHVAHAARAGPLTFPS